MTYDDTRNTAWNHARASAIAPTPPGSPATPPVTPAGTSPSTRFATLPGKRPVTPPTTSQTGVAFPAQEGSVEPW